MKCWRVDLTDCDRVIVLAETPGKATAKAVAEASGWGGMDGWWGVDWKQIRRKRLPAIDGDLLTERQLVEAGVMWTWCRTCDERIGDGPYVHEDVVWNAHGAAFCCPACRDEHPCWEDVDPYTLPTTAVLLSTED